jgi:DNA-binding transcriptional MerR regulator
MAEGPDTADTTAMFAISVAAQRADMQIQNLRVYERRGLLRPARTSGGTRLYSEADIEVLRRIAQLLREGLNLAGVARVLDLEEELSALRTHLRARHGTRGQSHGLRATTVHRRVSSS